MATILLPRTREMGLKRLKRELRLFSSHIAAGRRSYNNSAVLSLLLQVRQICICPSDMKLFLSFQVFQVPEKIYLLHFFPSLFIFNLHNYQLRLSILDFIFPSGRGFLLSTSCNRGGVFPVDMLKFWDQRELFRVDISQK